MLLPPNAPAVSGRAAIREFWATDSATTTGAGLKFVLRGTARQVSATCLRIRILKVVDASGAAVATGKYIGVFKKVDGKWLLARDTWNTDAPPPG